MIRIVSGPLSYILNFIYPPSCLVCDGLMKAHEKMICHACWSSLHRVEGKVEKGIIVRSDIDEIRSGFYYDDVFQKVIHHFKYQRAIMLAEKFAEILSDIILNDAHWRRSDLLVPVPLHAVKKRERSYNQADEISKRLSRLVNIPFRNDILKRVVNTVSQTKMPTAADRVKNMNDVFSLLDTRAVQGKQIILLDDLITTGATANSCAAVLKQAGAQGVLVLTAARPMLE